PVGSALDVQPGAAIDLEPEAAPDARGDAAQVRPLGAGPAEDLLGDEAGPVVAESLDEEPQGVGIAAPDVLGVEGAVAGAVRLEQRRPVAGFTPTVVAEADLRPEQDHAANVVGAVGDVVVLRGLQRPAPTPHPVEETDRVEQAAAGGEVSAHPEDLEPVAPAQPLR